MLLYSWDMVFFYIIGRLDNTLLNIRFDVSSDMHRIRAAMRLCGSWITNPPREEATPLPSHNHTMSHLALGEQWKRSLFATSSVSHHITSYPSISVSPARKITVRPSIAPLYHHFKLRRDVTAAYLIPGRIALGNVQSCWEHGDAVIWLTWRWLVDHVCLAF